MMTRQQHVFVYTCANALAKLTALHTLCKSASFQQVTVGWYTTSTNQSASLIEKGWHLEAKTVHLHLCGTSASQITSVTAAVSACAYV